MWNGAVVDYLRVMRGAIPPLPQYVFMAWCSVEAQGQLLLSQHFLANGESHENSQTSGSLREAT
jgi:hypothetical protein